MILNSTYKLCVYNGVYLVPTKTVPIYKANFPAETVPYQLIHILYIDCMNRFHAVFKEFMRTMCE